MSRDVRTALRLYIDSQLQSIILEDKEAILALSDIANALINSLYEFSGKATVHTWNSLKINLTFISHKQTSYEAIKSVIYMLYRQRYISEYTQSILLTVGFYGNES